MINEWFATLCEVENVKLLFHQSLHSYENIIIEELNKE